MFGGHKLFGKRHPKVVPEKAHPEPHKVSNEIASEPYRPPRAKRTENEDDGSGALIGAAILTEILSETSNTDASTSPAVDTPDTSSDFGGFGGGESGGGGASGDF
jgi:hypothetical protein